ncbi:MAG: cytochrome c oxidase subunit II [Melioribacteraceae bacterium]
MNTNPTEFVQLVDSSMLIMMGISTVFFLGIMGVMIYFVFKYHRKKGNKPVDIHGSIALEITWFVIPLILVMGMFFESSDTYKIFKTTPENAFEVDVTARMWDWDFNYKNGMKTDTLYVEVGIPVKLNLTSVDVNHSFYVPAFRIKQDVVDGSIAPLNFTPTKVGSYNVACAEYCGLNHSQMYTKVVVMASDEFKNWYGSNSSETTKANIVE